MMTSVSIFLLVQLRPENNYVKQILITLSSVIE